MIIISNTSPIINLAIVGQLDLLRQLYGKVVIPRAVYEEITAIGTECPNVAEAAGSSWIETAQVTNRAMVALLQMELDAGEAEAIALAVELKADVLLLDERKGRKVAASANRG